MQASIMFQKVTQHLHTEAGLVHFDFDMVVNLPHSCGWAEVDVGQPVRGLLMDNPLSMLCVGRVCHTLRICALFPHTFLLQQLNHC